MSTANTIEYGFSKLQQNIEQARLSLSRTVQTIALDKELLAWVVEGHKFVRDWNADECENSKRHEPWLCEAPNGDEMHLTVYRTYTDGVCSRTVLDCDCEDYELSSSNRDLRSCPHTQCLQQLLTDQEIADVDTFTDSELVLKVKAETLNALKETLKTLKPLGFAVPQFSSYGSPAPLLSPDGYYRAEARYEGR